MEQLKGPKLASRIHRYSVSHLTDIGYKTNTSLDISRFSVEAVEAGIVNGPSAVPKSVSMPLSEISLNQNRGWSADSLNSIEDHCVFPTNTPHRPQRQPRNAPSEIDTQIDDGFARFLKQHSSPTHQRVTAGGRIVPMEPVPAPPQFSLLTNTPACGKDSASPQKRADNPCIGSKRPAPALNGNTMVAADLPTIRLGQSQWNLNSVQGRNYGASQSTQRNTSAGELEGGNGLPRPPDLPHVTSESSQCLPPTLTGSASSFNVYPQMLLHNQWGSSAYPLPGMFFNPYANMPIPSGDREPILPTPVLQNIDFSSTSSVGQMNLPIPCGDDIDLQAQHGLQPAFGASFNQSMPLSSTGSNPLCHPGSALLDHRMRTMEQPPRSFGWQMGAHYQADHMGQTPATNMSTNIRLTSHLSAPASNGTIGKVTVGDVTMAEREFQGLDDKLRGHDQYTAGHYLHFTPELKSHYAAQRMELVERRDVARRRWMQLLTALNEARSAHRSVPEPINHQHTSAMKRVAASSSQKTGNTNLNVQAAAWVPKKVDQLSGVPNKLQSGEVNLKQFASAEKLATSVSSFEHASFAARMQKPVGFSTAKKSNVRSASSDFSHVRPGPYTKHLSDASCTELSDQDVDEWGARRGRAPPELAQKQSEEEMNILSQQRAEWRARTESAPANPRHNVGTASIEASSHPVDEWGARIGHAPLALTQQQNEQCAKLAPMHPDQRSQVSLTTPDSLPLGKSSANKTVSFVENKANAVPQNGHGSDDDDMVSSAGSDESGWRPMKCGEAPGPTKEDWQALLEAGSKQKGVKTKVHLATGESIVVEGTGPRVVPLSTARKGDKIEGTPKHQSLMSAEERASITRQLMRVEKGIWGLDEATRKPGGSRLSPWIIPDENDFFRNKGLSSVAIQSVTAQGTVPGFDGAGNRPECKALTPVPAGECKANGSPPKRSLKDIWAGPSRRAHVQEANHEEATRDIENAMWKY